MVGKRITPVLGATVEFPLGETLIFNRSTGASAAAEWGFLENSQDRPEYKLTLKDLTWFCCIVCPLPQMKTVSVALVLCLNVGVDPPDVVKTSPCARLECWIGESTHQHECLMDKSWTKLL